MSPFVVVSRMAACVAAFLGALVLLAWFWLRGDTAAGIACAAGLALVGSMVKPDAADVNNLRDLLDRINNERG